MSRLGWEIPRGSEMGEPPIRGKPAPKRGGHGMGALRSRLRQQKNKRGMACAQPLVRAGGACTRKDVRKQMGKVLDQMLREIVT